MVLAIPHVWAKGLGTMTVCLPRLTTVHRVGHTAAPMPLLPAALGLYPDAVVRLLRGLALAGQPAPRMASDA